MYNILVCDDEVDITNALRIYLSAEGYTVVAVNNGKDALEKLKNDQFHLVLLDIMMPELDGITVTAKIRETQNIPIILLTAKSEDSDKVLGLSIGADDYITKPFNPLEVIARVKSHLRRYTHLGSLPVEENTLIIQGIQLDDSAKKVLVDGEEVFLTPKEFEILKLLMQHPDKVFSAKEIYQKIWGASLLDADGTVAVHIRHLREKLETDPANPRYLKVVWGHGYKITSGVIK